jgi:hypothetical protein
MDFDRSGNNHSGKYYDGFINENKQLYNGNHIIIIKFIVEIIIIYNVFFFAFRNRAVNLPTGYIVSGGKTRYVVIKISGMLGVL